MRLPTVDEETGEESYEVLFTTGLIPPGQYCNQVTLTGALEPGEYNVTLHVQPYRMSGKPPTNNADMETVLIVEQKRRKQPHAEVFEPGTDVEPAVRGNRVGGYQYYHRWRHLCGTRVNRRAREKTSIRT